MEYDKDKDKDKYNALIQLGVEDTCQTKHPGEDVSGSKKKKRRMTDHFYPK